MADGVELNAGSGGVTAATDDCGASGHAQVVKLAISTDGSATLIPSDGTNGLLVNLGANNDVTITGTVDLGATDNAVLDAIAAATAATQAAVEGTLTVGSHAVTNAGTFAVQASSVVPGTAATNLGKAEDAAHTTGDVGVMALTVRQDTPAALGGTDGDYQPPITDGSGRMWTIAAQSGTWNITNISGTVSLPTGAATAAKQPALGTAGSASTDVISVQGIASMTPLLVDGSGVTQPVSGTVTANLSATDNAVLDVVASPVATISATPLQRVAIFDAADAQITSFGGGTQYTEDAAAAANPVGTAPILVRADTPAGVTSANGDNVAQRGTDYGAAFVQVVDSSGNFIDTFGGSGGTAAADDADFTAGTTQATPIMGVYESTPTAVTDGDMGIPGITANRELKVAVTSGGVAGKSVDDASGGTDEGVVGLLVRDDTLATLTPADGDYTTGRVNARGAQWVCLDSTVAQNVTVAAALPAGTNNIGDVDIVTMPNVTLAAGTNTNEVVGDAAHDAAIAGNPVRLAGRALTSDYTAVAAGDTADLITTLLGKLVTIPYANPANTWSYASPAAVTDTADDEAKAAGSAGVRHYITGVQVFNGHDTVGTEVVIKDGSTVLWRGWAEQTGGGCSARFDPPLRGTAATAVNVANITTGSATYFNLQGFSAAE